MTPEQLQAKLVLLADTLARLRGLPIRSLAEFRADDRTVDAALHRLQVAIQILIDVGGHVVAKHGLGAPESARDVLVRLERAGRLPVGSTARFGRAFTFRNRIVHVYDRVDDVTVYGIVRDDIGELEALARLLIAAESAS